MLLIILGFLIFGKVKCGGPMKLNLLRLGSSITVPSSLTIKNTTSQPFTVFGSDFNQKILQQFVLGPYQTTMGISPNFLIEFYPGLTMPVPFAVQLTFDPSPNQPTRILNGLHTKFYGQYTPSSSSVGTITINALPYVQIPDTVTIINNTGQSFPATLDPQNCSEATFSIVPGKNIIPGPSFAAMSDPHVCDNLFEYIYAGYNPGYGCDANHFVMTPSTTDPGTYIIIKQVAPAP
jgi:hypothetical protein